METRRRPIGYLAIGVIVIALIAWLTGRYLVKRELLRNLGTNEMQVRVDAARKLLDMEKLEDSLPAQPIIRRSKTAQALGEIGTEEAMRILGIILRDQEEAPRRWARQALEKQGERAVPTLLAALSAGGDTSDQAIQALEKIGASTAPKARFLLSDGSSRGGAAEALSKTGPVGISALLRACHNPDNDMRKPALDNLGLEAIQAAVDPALDNVRNPTEDAVKKKAIKALGLIGERRAVPDLIPSLQETSFREAAATALGQIGDPRAV
ncbi:MAG: HEAT repeat domain-containing protein, partial [Armatimonadota bacterium]